MNSKINWNLISELYKVRVEDIHFIQQAMIEKSLLNAGWVQDRSPTRSEYKKVWAIAVSFDEDGKGMLDKLQHGYEVIDRHFDA